MNTCRPQPIYKIEWNVEKKSWEDTLRERGSEKWVTDILQWNKFFGRINEL